MAGCERIATEAIGKLEHRVEPDVAVAADAWVRGLAGCISGNKRVDDAGPELVAKVDREMREALGVR